MNVWIAWWEGRQQPRAFLKALVLGGGVPRDGGDCQWLAAPKMEGDLCFHLV